MSLSTITSRPALGPTQSLIKCVTGGKRSERETDHSLVCSAEDNAWDITPLPHTLSRRGI
jgi:hypothetical protein